MKRRKKMDKATPSLEQYQRGWESLAGMMEALHQVAKVRLTGLVGVDTISVSLAQDLCTQSFKLALLGVRVALAGNPEILTTAFECGVDLLAVSENELQAEMDKLISQDAVGGVS